MNPGVHGRSAVSASRRLRVTTPVGRTSLATSHPALGRKLGCELVEAPTGHGGRGASCEVRTAAPAAAHAVDDAVDGSPRWPSAVPGRVDPQLGGERVSPHSNAKSHAGTTERKQV